MFTGIEKSMQLTTCKEIRTGKVTVSVNSQNDIESTSVTFKYPMSAIPDAVFLSPGIQNSLGSVDFGCYNYTKSGFTINSKYTKAGTTAFDVSYMAVIF